MIKRFFRNSWLIRLIIGFLKFVFSLHVMIIILLVLVTISMSAAYIDIGQFHECTIDKGQLSLMAELKSLKPKYLTSLFNLMILLLKLLSPIISFIESLACNLSDSPKTAQDLLVKSAGFILAISGFIYSAIRISNTEKYRREDQRIERYTEALRNLYTTDKQDLQLLGVRELYNVYLEEDKLLLKKPLRSRILGSVFEYIHQISVNIKKQRIKEDDRDKNTQEINPNHINDVNLKNNFTVDKIFDLFMRKNINFPLRYQISLGEAELEKTELEGVNLIRANLMDTNLLKANLKWSKLMRANLMKANLMEANLEAANLKRAKLQEANLMRANLEGANLRRAKLQEANLMGANLEAANLRRAKLQEANLMGANLEAANLKRANLMGALVGFVENKNIEEDKDYARPWSNWEKETEDCWEKQGWTAKTMDKDTPNLPSFYKKKLKNENNFYIRVLKKRRE